MKLDDDREIEEARAFFQDCGLLPPIPDQYADDEGTAERVRARVLSQAPPAAGSGVWRRRALLAAAVVVLVAIGWSSQVFLRGASVEAAETPAMLFYSVAGPGAVASAPSSAGVLRAGARKVAAVPPKSRTGNVQHVARYGWLLSEHVDANQTVDVAIHPTLTQWWLAPDGAVRVDESRAAPLDLNGRLTADVPSAPNQATIDTSPAGTIDPDLAERLSVEPAVLRSELLATQAGLPCDQDARWLAQCLVQAVQVVYDQYVVPPELASAMWRVLADESTLHTLGTTVDRLGREADTVALPPEPGQPSEQVTVLLISTDTGAYLGTETIVLSDPNLKISEPTVLGFSELSAARWVAALGDSS